MKKMRLNLCKGLLGIAMITVSLNADAQWMKKKNMPSGGAGRRHSHSFAVNNKVYMAGGYVAMFTNMNDLVEFDPAGNVWKTKNNLPGGVNNRSAGVTFTINGKVYLGLGAENYNSFTPPPVFLKDLWEYNPSGDTWTKKADLPDSGRADARVMIVNNKAYVIGGYTGSLSTDIWYSDDVWEYDPGTNKWTSKKPYPGGNINYCMTFTTGGKGYLTGGTIEGSSGEIESSKTFQYDAAADSWIPKKDFPDTRYGGVSFTINDKAYVGLGSNGSTPWPTDFYIYDVATDAWQYVPGGAEYPGGGKYVATAAVLNNKVYIGGGLSADGSLSAEMYELDPSSLLSVGELSTGKAVTCYPNPAATELYINKNNAAYTMYNITGQQVLQGITEKGGSIDIRNIPAGQYIMELYAGDMITRELVNIVH